MEGLNSSDDNNSTDEPSTELVPDTVNAIVTPSGTKKRSHEPFYYEKMAGYSKSVRYEEWLFDSGASEHVTPNKKLLLKPIPCKRNIIVTEGYRIATGIP
jgi:hypothetical protein